MDVKQSINKTRSGFESSFAESNFYNLQTQDEKHLELILQNLRIKNGYTVVDLGTGSGYLAFPIALKYPECNIIGLDIVEKTLELNTQRSHENGQFNLKFQCYDGLKLPFEDESIDLIVTRYVVHHFPEIEYAFQEISRVLKKDGQLFLSDPTPNENDTVGFVDSYMQMKKDGHIKFYTHNEFVDLSKRVGLSLDNSFRTKIRFPRKNAKEYNGIISQVEKKILDGYEIQILNDEIYITEKVLNLSFIKNLG